MHSCVATDHYRHASHEHSPAAAPRHPTTASAAATGPSSQSHLADGAYTALKWPTGSGNGAECMCMMCVGAAKATVALDSMFDAEKLTRRASEQQRCDDGASTGVAKKASPRGQGAVMQQCCAGAW